MADQWHLEALSRKMNVPGTLLKRKIAFWQSHGLIEEISTNVFQLREENVNDGASAQEDVEEYETESAMASAEDQREEELQVSLVIGNFTVRLETNNFFPDILVVYHWHVNESGFVAVGKDTSNVENVRISRTNNRMYHTGIKEISR